jgi:hypothetical protein
MDIDSPKPDPGIGKAAEANAEIAGRMQNLAEEQYADQKKLFDEYSPVLKNLLQTSLSQQQKSIDQSDSAWASYNDTWKPVEAKLAQQSLDWASPGRQEQEALAAGSRVATTFDQARADTRQALQTSGMDAGTIATLEAAGRLEEAKAKAGAMDTARRDTEKAGIAYLDNAARFGRNMTSTGIATAQLAGSQGQQAQGGYGTLTAASAQPGQAAGSLYSQAVGANNAAGNLYVSKFRAESDAAAANQGFFGDIIGAGLGAAGMAGGFGKLFSSSEKTKDMGPKVEGASEAVEKSPAKHWRYKPGMGDGSTKERMGPTAESLADVAPSVSDGKKVDGIAMLGLHHAAIGEQNKRLKALEKRLSLGDY